MEFLKHPEIHKERGYREHWLDLAKAIGIILVVWAHALPKDNYMWIWINSVAARQNRQNGAPSEQKLYT